MSLSHLSLLAILVPDYDAGIAFFCDMLGFDLLENTDMGAGKRWVRVAPKGAQTEFLLARAVGDQAQAIGAQGGGRVWLFLRSDDFDADYTALKAKGVHFEESPRDEPYCKVVVFRDPFGNRWDLLGPAKL
ncbi:VOC family protein [Pacificibacter marinus]|uniref:Glyoxalase/Bleomycin resistance protein/Dioxygenase superfamily protein n=1 Tax=Pacificibacter marinus TaxID=658057 RepID=A0A1Y5SMR9_9RHOB|nr:VOC family protein [Pacificibacter marinus]SEK62166.1 Catechol 2,3-dioxygenase [Pacificibacter marinus]SLN41215.1 Glyoxalase/Bleomycin resistance protein/Dioxygenase superfamily protein [Pacificibacter marinus]